jgi:glucose/arabinose dehydrogenase
MRRTLFAVPLAVLLFVGAVPLAPTTGEADAIVAPVEVQLQTVASGLSRPLLATHAGDGSGRLFIVEQGGLVKVLRNGAVEATPWLDVRSKVSCCGERGLLGVAFYPDFETSGRVIISYTRAGDGASVLERIVVPNPAVGPAPPNGQVLLVQSQPYSNHNGGHVAFGPDGYLYFGLGDGGSGGDPQNHAQNMNSLLGKMLRLDVSGAGGYTIPASNPFVNGGGRAEIYASGLRNPWRFSFDRETGDLWIADVGQNQMEEVNLQLANTPGGQNYGWRPWEGTNPYRLTEAAHPRSLTMTFPVITYSHAEGCSITGGHVYRGAAIEALQGAYIYGDYCAGTIWASVGVGPLQVPLPLFQSSFNISSFGEDEAGEVYVVNLNGSVARIVAA